jgi:hypothetical protein
MKRLRYRWVAFVCFAVVGAVSWKPAIAQKDDFYWKAERCLNEHARTGGDINTALDCINTIAHRTDPESNALICDIRMLHQGYRVWNLPIFFTDSVDPPILILLKAISVRDLDTDYALTYLRGDCRRSGDWRYGLFGDLYYLRATLLKISALDAGSMRMNLPTQVGTLEAYEVEVALSLIFGDCAGRQADRLCNIPRWTHDHLGPGATLYERFANSFRAPPMNDAIPADSAQEIDARLMRTSR